MKFIMQMKNEKGQSQVDVTFFVFVFFPIISLLVSLVQRYGY